MKTFFSAILAGVLLTGISLAQTAGEAQGNASASQDTSVSRSGNGAQAQSDTAVQGAADTAVSSPSQNRSAQASTSNQGSSNGAVSNQAAPNKTIHATLEKPIDARKNKPGDQVVAKTTQTTTSNDGVAIPKGSKIIGHVTEAKAKQKGESQSAVGVVFDHAVLKNGQQVPLNASIQAISSSQNNAAASALNDEPMMAGGASSSGMGAGRATTGAGGLAGGTGSVAGGAAGTVASTTRSVDANTEATLNGTANGAASVPNGAASSTLSSTSYGVSGINGLSLNNAAADSTEGSVISSTSHNVHLDSGTEMILQVTK
jgi:hypothetical protein